MTGKPFDYKDRGDALSSRSTEWAGPVDGRLVAGGYWDCLQSCEPMAVKPFNYKDRGDGISNRTTEWVGLADDRLGLGGYCDCLQFASP